MDDKKWPILYNLSLQKTAYLQRAAKISYTKKHNGLWTGSFELPADDPKTADCRINWYVELFDSSRVELFRIADKDTIRQGGQTFIRYELEHVLATLMDDVLYRYHEIGGVGTYTTEIVQYILDEQSTANWQIGTIDFTRQFQYSWENENLLAALMSVPKPFDTDHRWSWSTISYPWTLNLQTAITDRGPEVRASRNMKEMVYSEDARQLCTRLYALGQGEGVNQLGIENENPTGEAYIDASTIGTYGQIARVWVDRRYESEASLYNAAVAMLEELKEPRVEVSVTAADLKNITNSDVDKFIIGAPVTIYDDDLSVDYDSRVIELSKPDVYGQPDVVNIAIANKPQDVAGTIADLASRSRINEVYSQGATNMDSHQMADNCDATYPIVVKFHLSTDAVFINKAYLNYDTTAFRAYSKGAESGGSSETTSASGGGSSVTSASGGSTTESSSSNGSHSHTVSGQSASSTGSHRHSISGWDTGLVGSHRHYVYGTSQYSGYSGAHNHSITGQTSQYAGSHSHSVTGTTSSSASNHTHSVSIGNHSHSVSIPSHTHGITIDAHTHDIDYGIYSGPTPTAVTVAVDGNTISGLGISEEEVDIMDYLSRDGGGKITRGFHEITITPNTLGRINVVVHIQQFIQSKGSVRV